MSDKSESFEDVKKRLFGDKILNREDLLEILFNDQQKKIDELENKFKVAIKECCKLEQELQTTEKENEILREAVYCIKSILYREIKEYGNSSELVEMQDVCDTALEKIENMEEEK